MKTKVESLKELEVNGLKVMIDESCSIGFKKESKEQKTSLRTFLETLIENILDEFEVDIEKLVHIELKDYDDKHFEIVLV